MAGCFLGIDSGLTVTKAVVFDEGGAILSQGRREVARIQPAARHVERDMAEHWRETAGAIRDALDAAGLAGSAIAAVGVTGHGDGIYLLDGDLEPLGHAIVSLDSRGAEAVESWRTDGVLDAALQLTGQHPYPAAPSALLAWCKRYAPERFRAIRWILSCKDWLRFRLTGRIATDLTEASVSFTDCRTQTYSPEALRLFGLEELAPALPEALEPCALAGRVTEAAAAETGLVAGTPVATGLHDVTASAVGSGVVDIGWLSIVAGTFSINQVLSAAPHPDPGWYSRNGFRPGLWMNMAISPASSANIDWMVKTLCPDAMAQAAREGGSPFALLDAELDAAFADPGTVVYHPFLYGSPHGEVATAAFLGLQGWHGRGHMLRALFEGVVFNHRTHVAALRAAFPLAKARLCGGGARSARLCQLFADALDLTVETVACDETGALGAALCAAVATGQFGSLAEAAQATTMVATIHRPDPCRRAALDAGYDRYLGSIRQLAPAWASLREQ